METLANNEQTVATVSKSNNKMIRMLDEQNDSYKISLNEPKLRRNKRLEEKMGIKYVNAMRQAIFSFCNIPYMPLEPPESLKNNDEQLQSVYICKQCKDCFRFLKSYEDHISRRSWIVGYWCHSCFISDCKHTLESLTSPCVACLTVDEEKRFYLRSRGQRKGQKKGLIKVFYNQCQFFEHLRLHDIKVVEPTDVILMPLPNALEKNTNMELNSLCEALFEHAFISRTHIIDWLKQHKIENNWWMYSETNMLQGHEFIAEIIKGYRPVRYFQDLLHSRLKELKPNGSSHVFQSKLSKTSSADNSDMRVSPLFIDLDNTDTEEERSDDPCPPVDIEFADCGPAPKVYYIQNKSRAMKKVKRKLENNVISNKTLQRNINNTLQDPSSTQLAMLPVASSSDRFDSNVCKPKISVKKFANDLIWTQAENKSGSRNSLSTIKNLKSQVTSSVVPNVKVSSSIQSSKKMKTDTKILTLCGPKGVNISTLIKQLPRDVINKKIVFLGQQINNVVSLKGSQNTMKAYKNIVSVQGDSKKSQVFQILPSIKSGTSAAKGKPGTESSKILITDTNVNDATVSNGSTNKFVVYQNGRKYIMKPKELKVPSNASTKNHQKSVSLLQNSVVVSSPKSSKPIPKLRTIVSKATSLIKAAQKASSSNNQAIDKFENTVKAEFEEQAKFEEHVGRCLETDFTGEHLKIMYQEQNPVVRPALRLGRSNNWQSMVLKHRQQMLSNLPNLTNDELKKRINHFQAILNRYKKFMGVKRDAAIMNHDKMILILEEVLKQIKEKQCREEVVDPEFEDMFNNWETKIDQSEINMCSDCGKKTKPSSYIFGLSKEPRDPSVYCTCGEFICYICGLYQGNMTRYRAHIGLHKKEDNFTCPECFQKFSSYKNLAVHVWTNCFHPLTRRLLGCKVCQIDGFENMEGLSRHFALMHSEKRVACSKCQRVFITHAECRTHQMEKHPDDMDKVKILKLMVCNVGHCVVNPNLYRSHMNAHIGTQKLLYYKCPICSVFVKDNSRSKDIVKHHLYVQHRNQLSEIIEEDVLKEVLSSKVCEEVRKDTFSTSSKDKDNSQKAKDETVMIIPKIVNACTIPPEVFESVNQKDGPTSTVSSVQTIDMLDNTSSAFFINEEDPGMPAIVDVRSEANSIVSSSDDLVLPTSNESTESTNVFDSTSESEMNMSKSSYAISEFQNDSEITDIDISGFPVEMTNALNGQKINLKTEVETIEEKPRRKRPCRIALNGPSADKFVQDYKCHLCGELINTSWSVVKRHFATKHADTCKLSIITPKLLRITNEFIERGYQDYVAKKRKPESGSPQKRRKRWTPKKHTEHIVERMAGIYVKPEPVQDAQGNFVCKKCDMHCEDVESLREHIAKNHRIRGLYLICLECGENFIVAPSLQMHLKAFHRIEDPITYMNQNPAYAPNIADDFEETTKTTVANQCHVCKAVFEDKAAVDKHLRVHGMAFLNRKRIEARNAAKGPIKKLKLNDSVSSADKVSSSSEVLPSNKEMVKRNDTPEKKHGEDITEETNETF